MHTTLQCLNDAVHFEGKNNDGNTIHLDGSPEVGGEGKGVRPMQALLMSLAGCSSIDVVTPLKKMLQPLEDMRVEVIKKSVFIRQTRPIRVPSYHTGNHEGKKTSDAIRNHRHPHSNRPHPTTGAQHPHFPYQ